MTDKLKQRKQRYRVYRPFEIPAALLTGCAVTLIGVYQNVDPLDILIRATVSSLLIGGIVWIGLGIVRAVHVSDET